jgi:hypothetical protein
LSFSYWIDYLGFITEEKLAAIFIKPSLGVSNWPVIYFIKYTLTSFLAPSSPRHQSTSFLFSNPSLLSSCNELVISVNTMEKGGSPKKSSQAGMV